MDEQQIRRLLELVPNATLWPGVASTKRPAEKGWRNAAPGTRYFGQEVTLLLTGEQSGVFVVDCDSAAAARAFVEKYNIPPNSTLMISTRRGVHFYFRQPDFDVKCSSKQLLPDVDVKGWGGYVVAPGSPDKRILVDAPPSQAPASLLLDPALRREADVRPDGELTVPPHDTPVESRITMARIALKNEPPAVDGEGGHNTAIGVVGRTVRRFCLDVPAALEALQEWNECCKPPWSEKELVHKIEDSIRSSPYPWHTPEYQAARDGAMKALSPKERADVDVADGGRAAGSGKGKALSCSEVVAILECAPEWAGKFSFDIMQRRPFAVDPPAPLRMTMEVGTYSEEDVGEVRNWLEEMGWGKAPVRDVDLAMRMVCNRHPINPFIQYLQSIREPVGQPILPFLHSRVLNSPDGEIASLLFTKQLVAAVRRARSMPSPFERGRRIEHRLVVVLEGEQETGKSSLLRQLAGTDFYASVAGDVHDKDTLMKANGKVLVEMEEMYMARKADRNALKAFISATEDEYRKPYGRGIEKYPRSFVIFGTSNDLSFDDPTGNTRFAVIRVGKMCGRAALMEMRDQIWWEANCLALDESYSLELTEEEREFCLRRSQEYNNDDTTAAKIRISLRGTPFVTTLETYQSLPGSIDKALLTPGEEKQVVDALRRIGCRRYRSASGVDGWLVPPEIALQKSSNPNVAKWLKVDEAAERVRAAMMEKAN